jgi:hypothetical protein
LERPFSCGRGSLKYPSLTWRGPSYGPRHSSLSVLAIRGTCAQALCTHRTHIHARTYTRTAHTHSRSLARVHTLSLSCGHLFLRTSALAHIHPKDPRTHLGHVHSFGETVHHVISTHGEPQVCYVSVACDGLDELEQVVILHPTRSPVEHGTVRWCTTQTPSPQNETEL